MPFPPVITSFLRARAPLALPFPPCLALACLLTALPAAAAAEQGGVELIDGRVMCLPLIDKTPDTFHTTTTLEKP